MGDLVQFDSIWFGASWSDVWFGRYLTLTLARHAGGRGGYRESDHRTLLRFCIVQSDIVDLISLKFTLEGLMAT